MVKERSINPALQRTDGFEFSREAIMVPEILRNTPRPYHLRDQSRQSRGAPREWHQFMPSPWHSTPCLSQAWPHTQGIIRASCHLLRESQLSLREGFIPCLYLVLMKEVPTSVQPFCAQRFPPRSLAHRHLVPPSPWMTFSRSAHSPPFSVELFLCWKPPCTPLHFSCGA